MEEPPKHGHDEAFVDDTPDYVICTICHLVLRNPLLIISCGHKYCQPCFDLLKQNSRDNNTPLLCPNDNQPVDEGRVCEEHGLRRAIGCLRVKCGSYALGCTWVGELSELVFHQSQCQYRSQQQQQQQAFRQLEEKMEKRIVALKEEVNGLIKEEGRKNEEEINRLRDEGRKNGEEIDELKGLIGKLQAENFDLRVKHAASKLSVDELTWVRKAMKECGEAAAKEVKVSAKEVVLSKLTERSEGGKLFHFYGGARDNVVIGTDYRLAFSKPCILAVPAGVVFQGEKVYYEVTCSDLWKNAWFALGLANKNFKPLNYDVAQGVRDIYSVKWWESSNYYGYGRKCWENQKDVSPYYNDNDKIFGKGPKECVIGVAVDRNKSGHGQLLLSCDGQWSEPWGVAFKNLLKTEEYFPVFVGCNLTLKVNFGEEEFRYKPPDASYEKFRKLLNREEIQ